jgi:hypothetical protein
LRVSLRLMACLKASASSLRLRSLCNTRIRRVLLSSVAAKKWLEHCDLWPSRQRARVGPWMRQRVSWAASPFHVSEYYRTSSWLMNCFVWILCVIFLLTTVKVD